jgi:hypothetical protein
LDELVLQAAKEIHCSLVSFSPYELCDIPFDFYDQETSSTAEPSFEEAEEDGDAWFPDISASQQGLAWNIARGPS